MAGHAGGEVLQYETAESDDLGLLVFFDTFNDRIKDGGDSVFGGPLGGVATEGLLDSFNEFCLVHDKSCGLPRILAREIVGDFGEFRT